MVIIRIFQLLAGLYCVADGNLQTYAICSVGMAICYEIEALKEGKK